MERMTFLAINIITSNPGMKALIKASSISFGILNYCHAAPLLTVPQRYDKESLFSMSPRRVGNVEFLPQNLEVLLLESLLIPSILVTLVGIPGGIDWASIHGMPRVSMRE